MKRIHLAILCLFTALSVFSQDFCGRAVYQSSSVMKVSFSPPPVDSTDQTKPPKPSMATSREKDLNKQIRKSMQKEYELLFNKTESLFREIPKLKDPNQENSVEVIGLGGGTEGGLYKDTGNRKYAENRDVFGKLFLVQDELEQLDWQLHNETKKVGNFTCHKATAVKISRKIKTVMENSEERKVEKIIETAITAWYSPEIAINQGPAEYWGLPGFILEVNNGKLHMVCSEIVLNPDEKVVIKAPAKGKKADRSTFEKVYNKKVEEMVKMYETKRKKERS